MKAVMLSIRPQWCEKICHQIGTENGKPVYEKSLDVRKNKPKIPTPFKCYIYCIVYGPVIWENGKPMNGKVVGEFTCDNIKCFDVPYPAFQNKLDKSIIAGSCCTYYMLHRYAYHDALCGWHISALQIYGKPKELREFKQCDKCPYGPAGRCKEHEFSCDGTYALTRPPQSWGYVEELQ